MRQKKRFRGEAIGDTTLCTYELFATLKQLGIVATMGCCVLNDQEFWNLALKGLANGESRIFCMFIPVFLVIRMNLTLFIDNPDLDLVASTMRSVNGARIYRTLSSAFRPSTRGKDEVGVVNSPSVPPEDIKTLISLSPVSLDILDRALTGELHADLPPYFSPRLKEQLILRPF